MSRDELTLRAWADQCRERADEAIAMPARTAHDIHHAAYWTARAEAFREAAELLSPPPGTSSPSSPEAAVRHAAAAPAGAAFYDRQAQRERDAESLMDADREAGR